MDEIKNLEQDDISLQNMEAELNVHDHIQTHTQHYVKYNFFKCKTLSDIPKIVFINSIFFQF